MLMICANFRASSNKTSTSLLQPELLNIFIIILASISSPVIGELSSVSDTVAIATSISPATQQNTTQIPRQSPPSTTITSPTEATLAAAPTTTATTTTTTTTASSASLASILVQKGNNNNLEVSIAKQVPFCTLGNDTYQLGERWNPNLPPFGVQVCVQCECSIRQRKNCYEPKVTCRRITNECPIIDSCPDGKKPVTNAGQCCKSCQNTIGASSSDANTQATDFNYKHSSSASANQKNDMYEKIYYKNERIKEYQTIIKNLEACPRRDSDRQLNQILIKLPKGNKNDLNGIDSRLAFKSLHDSQGNHITSSKNKNRDNNSRAQQDFKDSNSGGGRQQFFDDTMRHDHQHPNDVQSSSGFSSSVLNSNSQQNHKFGFASTTSTTNITNINLFKQQRIPSINTCTLGNETFEVGDTWNPDLPPFGIQFCVQCNCIAIKQRTKTYPETKVNCRRLNNDCPKIDVCPDGKKPISIPGQCCKACQSLLLNE